MQGDKATAARQVSLNAVPCAAVKADRLACTGKAQGRIIVAFGIGAQAKLDRREAPREEVYHRTRLVIGTSAIPVQLVNISASGFMARTEAEIAPGTTLTLRLPVIGERAAEVRWALAGRVGCQFARSIDLAQYLELLGALAKEAR